MDQISGAASHLGFISFPHFFGSSKPSDARKCRVEPPVTPGTHRGDSLRSSEMDRTDTPGMRKRLMSEQSLRPPERPGEIDIASRATLAYSSEDPAHPVEHLIDGHYGRGSTHWASGRTNATDRIVLEFDH